MITKIGVPFKGLAGDGFSGSYKGMRFFMKTYDKENITVYVYPEPYSFEHTKEELKETITFPYTEEGVDQCINWLNEKYEKDKTIFCRCCHPDMGRDGRACPVVEKRRGSFFG